jgi:hypothetical protein
MLFKNCFILFSTALITACGSVPKSSEISTANTVKSETKNSINKFSDLKYTPYTFSEPVSINISTESQSYKFANGESNLMSFRINGDLKLLEISSQASGIWIPSMTVYLPSVLFLDSNFIEIKNTEPKYYYSTGKMNDTRPSIYYGAITIPEKSEYAIIYSDSAKLSEKAPMLHGGAGADRLVTALREEYSKIDSQAFANNKVKSFIDLGYRPSTHLARSSTGTIRVHFSK